MFNTTLGKIEYLTDQEYRICIAQIFGIPKDLDDYSFEPIFDDIYEKTKDDPFFKKIYTIAAGFMLSEDPNVGMCVLFAYDYAKAFYAVLCDYLNGANEETLDATKNALEKLLERR
jgi:hypothetical protein